MSIHSSLKIGRKARHRSVIKRFEKIKALIDKEKWREGDSVYDLPKIKMLKLKIKKEKAVAAEGAEGAAPPEGAAAPAAGAAKEKAGAVKDKAAAPAKEKARALPSK